MPQQFKETAFDKDKIKLSDLADITIIDAPSLARLSTFNTSKLSVEQNTPLARAIRERMDQDPFLRDFGRSENDETLNARDNTTLTRNYLNQEFKRRGQPFNEDYRSYTALSDFDREKLSY